MASILVVDDAQTSRDIMGRVLSAFGHMVAFATDGSEALGKAKEVKPDLVLMDIVMPRMDGFKAMRTLKDDPSTASIPVVLVSTKNGESDIFWGKKQGAAEYLPKPFTEQSLVSVVHRILGLSAPAASAHSMSAPAQSYQAPAPTGTPSAATGPALEAIEKAFMRAMGPFGKVTFKKEVGNLGIPLDQVTRSHLGILVNALSSAITDAAHRRDFDSTVRQYT